MASSGGSSESYRRGKLSSGESSGRAEAGGGAGAVAMDEGLVCVACGEEGPATEEQEGSQLVLGAPVRSLAGVDGSGFFVGGERSRMGVAARCLWLGIAGMSGPRSSM